MPEMIAARNLPTVNAPLYDQMARSRRGLQARLRPRRPGAARACRAVAGLGRDPCASRVLRPRTPPLPPSVERCDPDREHVVRCMGPGLFPIARAASDRRRDDV